MRGTITSSMRCLQDFPYSRSRLSIYKRLRPTIISTRYKTQHFSGMSWCDRVAQIRRNAPSGITDVPFLSAQGGDCAIKGKNDGEDFRRLLAAMEILHFTPDVQSAIFRVLSSILHLGNVYFQKYEVLLYY